MWAPLREATSRPRNLFGSLISCRRAGHAHPLVPPLSPSMHTLPAPCLREALNLQPMRAAPSAMGRDRRPSNSLLQEVHQLASTLLVPVSSMVMVTSSPVPPTSQARGSSMVWWQRLRATMSVLRGRSVACAASSAGATCRCCRYLSVKLGIEGLLLCLGKEPSAGSAHASLRVVVSGLV